MTKHPFSAAISDTVTDVDANNRVTIKTMVLLNNTASRAYLQMFKTAASSVTLGTTTADVVVPVPASSGIALSWTDDGWHVGGNALSLAGTTGRANAVAAVIDTFITYGS